MRRLFVPDGEFRAFGSAMRSGAVAVALVALLTISDNASARRVAVPRISIDVDRKPVVQGEPFTITIQVETSSRGEPEIRLPAFHGFNVLQQSESMARTKGACEWRARRRLRSPSFRKIPASRSYSGRRTRSSHP